MGRQKHTAEEKRQNLTAYLNAKGGTYRSYMSLLGESFATRIDLLAQLLNEAHHPTTGRYKESLLADLIAGFVPGRYSVGTGFVLFPVESYQVEGFGDEAEGVLSIENHVPSRQMDIIVYDSHSYPVIFRDGDVVVVRPEAVRCLIEVKGQLTHEETDDLVGKFADFARKWQECVACYRACQVTLAHKPTLLGMCWAVKPDGEGRPVTDGARLRDRVVAAYQKEGVLDRIDRDFPLLSAVGIYKKHVVAVERHLADMEGVEIGYETLPGTCETAGRAMDRTVAFLLERVHLSLETRLANKAFSAPMPDDREVALSKDDKLGFSPLVKVPFEKLQAPKGE